MTIIEKQGYVAADKGYLLDNSPFQEGTPENDQWISGFYSYFAS